jgi:AMMECR1 domain-containing protein
MAGPFRGLDLTARWARWREKLARPARDAALDAVLSWIRTIALEDDVICIDAPPVLLARLVRGWVRDRCAYVRFGAPSLPSGRPELVKQPSDRAPARFVIRSRTHAVSESTDPSQFLPAVGEPGWRTILNVRDIVVMERDAPHGSERPLRLGLSAEEGFGILRQVRTSAERFLSGGKHDPRGIHPTENRRLAQRTALAVALWTRGRLRGSVIVSPGPAMRMVREAAMAACQDVRFARLSADDLNHTVFQVGFLHAPRVPLSRHEIETCDAYHDKALFVSDGTRSGVYMPEAFNVFARRTVRLQELTDSLARDKAGLKELGPSARVEVCELTELVESADRSRAVRLDGPVACLDDASVRTRVPAAGRSACEWLAAIQREDGSLPLYVRPTSGQAEGRDIVRCAMTAEALAAFGLAYGLESAVESARRVLAWLDRSRSEWTEKPGLSLPTTIYLGKAALALHDDDVVKASVKQVVEQLEGPDPGPLVLAHAASFLDVASRHHAAAPRCESLRDDLAAQFRRATASEKPMALAEWAELVAAFPAGSKTSEEVCDWLRNRQLPSGAFPETTASDFVYSRGTGKVFEVLALRPSESPGTLDRALGWLLSMQYTPDSAFFVPHEHWPRVLGGLRHDYFGPDAWIDAAGHLLLGLARLRDR